ncbi:MAG TPA: flagellar FlbD family protein [Bdellovibrionales bacterium]|nr:flagellar FlbD family protein [Bdellovibrionales bacterium]
MIQLSKLNREQVFINPDLIRWIEIRPDTVITFTDGHQLMVREKPDEIVQKIVQLRHAFINPQSLIKDKA